MACATSRRRTIPPAISPTTFILDPALRVLAVLPIADPLLHGRQLLELIGRLPPLAAMRQGRPSAPVLLVPQLFEREFCRELMALYDRHGGQDSGYMTSDASGKTVGVIDYGRKRRRDYQIDDAEARQGVRARIERRLVPEVRKAFQFRANFIERYIVACYDAGEGGYFRPHRDNTTKGTAHRRFAVTINLNAEDYDGGDLCFPEFGRESYRAPSGGAIVFSCSLMHEALPVTRGRRYAVLPFLYDESGAKLREANLGYLADDSCATTSSDRSRTAGASRDRWTSWRGRHDGRRTARRGRRRSREERSPQAEKTQAVVQLAGGIAHDFNNLLMTILGNSEMLTAKLQAGTPLHEMAA